MYLLCVSKYGGTLLVLELLCVLLSLVNGRPAFEDLEPAHENQDTDHDDQDMDGDEIEDENWEDDDDDESEKVERTKDEDTTVEKDCPGMQEFTEKTCVASTFKCCTSTSCAGKLGFLLKNCLPLAGKTDKDFEDQEKFEDI